MLKIVSSAKTGGPSKLELQAVAESTSRDYMRRLSLFEEFCQREGLPLHTDEEIEIALLEHFDESFLVGGLPLDYGTKLMASLATRWPHLQRAARGDLLPRARRALQGWGRLAPLTVRLPIPAVGVAGIAVELALAGHRSAALATMVGMDAYLRPGELLSLVKESVIPGRPALGRGHSRTSLLLFPSAGGVASTMGQFNDSIVLDSTNRKYLGPAVEALARTRAPAQSLFGLTDLAFRTLFKQAACRAGLSSWEATPHVLRHAGPSSDFLEKQRDLTTIKQ
jgi:hypothetical protein